MRNTMRNISRLRLLTASGFGWMFDAMDVILLSYIIAFLGSLFKWDPITKTIIILANNIGMLTGAFLFGYLADVYGRRKIFMTTLTIYSILTGLQGFVKDPYELALLRFFIGLGLGGELPVVATLVSELSEPEKRGENVVILESFWAYGSILAASVARFLIPFIGFTNTMILLALTALYVVVIRREVPEPLETINRVDEKISVKTLFREERRKIFASWIMWFSIAFGYYGVVMWLPDVVYSMKGFTIIKSFEYVLYMSLAQIPGYFSAAYLVERIGRRPVFLTYMFGSAVSGVLFAYSQAPEQVLLYGALLNFFNLGAWGVIYAYTPELFRAEYRATATGSSGSMARIGMIIGPMIPGISGSFVVSLLIFGAVWIFGSLAILTTPETKVRR